MSDTIDDVKLVNTAYFDLYAVTGIPRGTPLMIQNKNTAGVYVQQRATQPPVASRNGFLLVGNQACIVRDANISGVWAWGTSSLCVQALPL